MSFPEERKVDYGKVDWSAFVEDPRPTVKEVLYKVRNAPAHFEEVNEDNHRDFVKAQIEERRAEMQSLAREITELEETLEDLDSTTGDKE